MENTMMSNGLRRLLIIFGALLVVSLLASGFSAVYVTLAAPQRSTYFPSTVGFEGQLADSEGAPVADGDYAITFRLYADPETGTAVWTEAYKAPNPLVHVADGLYSVQLGSITPFPADAFNEARFLGIQVENDGEMTPRIPISAVPFALNAKQAQELQGYPVSEAEPGTNDLLGWSGNAWTPRDMLTLPDLAPVGSNASPNDLLQNYRSGAILRWKNATTVEVSAGELMINGYMRRNTGAVDITFADNDPAPGPTSLGLVGDPQPNDTYDIYAVADSDESSFDLRITENPNAPTGETNYRKLGEFRTYETSSPLEIMRGSVVNSLPDDDFAPAAYAYSSGNQSVGDGGFTINLQLDGWDNNNIHSMTSNNGRMTIQTPGLYLITGGVTHNPGSGGNCNNRTASIRLNGTETLKAQTVGCSGIAVFELTHIQSLDTGEYLEVRYSQLPGIWNTAYNGWMKVVKLGDTPD